MILFGCKFVLNQVESVAVLLTWHIFDYSSFLTAEVTPFN